MSMPEDELVTVEERARAWHLAKSAHGHEYDAMLALGSLDEWCGSTARQSSKWWLQRRMKRRRRRRACRARGRRAATSS